MANKTELLKFLDHHIFDPILKASADKYSEADKKKLQDVQDRTKKRKGPISSLQQRKRRSSIITGAICTHRPRSA
jgi:hypothetical protein